MSSVDESGRGAGYDRRRFLTRLGLGAAVATGGGSLVTAAGAHGARAAAGGHGVINTTSFTRLFPDLPPFSGQGQKLKDALRARQARRPARREGRAERRPGAADHRSRLSANNPNNPTHTAGTTFLGQFIDHDITFDATSRLGVPTEPQERRNCRTPALDLDSVYGGGPSARRSCTTRPTGRSSVESGGLFEDLPRDARRHRDHRRSAQRREPDHRRAALRVHPVPQPRRRLGPRTTGTGGDADAFARGAAG